MNRICYTCESEILIKEMSEVQRKQLFLKTVPKRFINAKKEDFKDGMIDDVISDNKGLFLFGGVGIGKSHFMATLAMCWLEKGYSVQRCNYDWLLLEIRNTYNHQGKTEIDIIRPYILADYLIVDDLGATVSDGHKESDFSYRTFQVLLNERDEQVRPTYITSNKSLDQIEHSFDERVKSRINRGKIIKLTGEDRRLNK